eukprot:scaffold2_cov94-Skeletonema_dohrnii-CCMP3373.AAC.4
MGISISSTSNLPLPSARLRYKLQAASTQTTDEPRYLDILGQLNALPQSHLLISKMASTFVAVCMPDNRHIFACRCSLFSLRAESSRVLSTLSRLTKYKYAQCFD